jgi:hypothetical protein
MAKPTAPSPGSEPEDNQPSAAVETIGPDEAKEILGSNKFNRKVSARRVTRYAMMMTRQKFIFTGESIIINNEELLDGAHRLRAIIQAGVILPFVVVRGVDTEAFKYIDSGAGRNMADSLFILSLPNHRLYAAAINYLTGFQLYNRWTIQGVEIPDRWKTYEEFQELEDIVPRYSGKLGVQGVNKGILVAAHALFHRKSEEQASEFMELATGSEDIPAGHPAGAFRAWMDAQYAKILATKKPSTPDVNAKAGNLLLRAWNEFRDGNIVDRLRPPTSAPEIK